MTKTTYMDNATSYCQMATLTIHISRELILDSPEVAAEVAANRARRAILKESARLKADVTQ